MCYSVLVLLETVSLRLPAWEMRGWEEGLFTPGMLFLEMCPRGTRGKARGGWEGREHKWKETISPLHLLKGWGDPDTHTHTSWPQRKKSISEERDNSYFKSQMAFQLQLFTVFCTYCYRIIRLNTRIQKYCNYHLFVLFHSITHLETPMFCLPYPRMS